MEAHTYCLEFLDALNRPLGLVVGRLLVGLGFRVWGLGFWGFGVLG